MYDKKALIHVKSWDVYINENENIINSGYSVEVVGADRKQFLWKVIEDHVVEEVNNHDKIELQGFDFNVFDKDKERFGREGLSEYHHLSILMKLWIGDRNSHLERMDMKVNKDNGKYEGMVNG